MTPQDEEYARAHFVPAGEESLRLTTAGVLPPPSYVLPDGTAMVPRDHLALVELAGGPEHVEAWYVDALQQVGFSPERARATWADVLAGRRTELVSVLPTFVVDAERRVAQAAAALAVLADAPAGTARRHDALASLHEAVEGGFGVRGLDQVLLPLPPHDAAGPDGAAPLRRTWVDEVRTRWFSPVPPELPVRTERLVLREPRLSDAADLADAYGDPAFMRYLLTEPMTPAEVQVMLWRRREPGVPHRTLALTVEADGRAVGDLVLMLQGTALLTAELGWTVHPAHAGLGYATEAARALIRIAFEHYDVRRIVANLDGDNERSAALAERLGMRREVDRVDDFWSKGRWTPSYEYALLREEWDGQT
ncbi:MAG: GNAT family N-acetyltransferase [Nocardioides sp.]|uniref:GNAT family N-acetyltransferase n=1 Tax=Nocardioides sp. TaxID=35761 RepID=UPI003F00115E